MKEMELVIGQILRWGLFLSVIISLIGGILYLRQYGHDPIHYQAFHAEPKHLKTTFGIVHAAWSLSATGVIQFGLLILVLTQILRVILTIWLFLQEKDVFFVGISVIILIVLIYSIFWRV